jgi:dipeptidyl aminopeptidase/acylaminoacyl peptidase
MKHLLVALVLLTPSVALAADKRPMTVDDLFKFKRVSDPQISPDGKHVVYVIGAVDMEKNTIPSSLWIAATDGKSKPRQLTNAAGKKDRHPRWSPNGKRVLFESNRSGDSQLWIIDLAGGEARRLTDSATGASDAVWSRDGKQIAFVSAVWPEYSDKPYKESNALNKKRKEEAEKNPVKAKVHTKLFYRHWDEYVEDKRQHLFVMEVESKAHGLQSVGLPRDVTPGDRDAFPTSDTFSTGDNFTFSPDGKYLVFTAPPERDEAWSTNYDICRVPVKGGKIECLTKDNKAADSGPQFSPDGKLLAFRAQKKPGYEADRWHLMVVETDAGGAFKAKPRSVSAKLDGSPDGFVWSYEQHLCFVGDKNAATALGVVGPKGEVDWSRAGGTIGSLSACPATGPGKAEEAGGPVYQIAYTKARLFQPPEVIVGELPHPPTYVVRNVSEANDKLLGELDLPRPERVKVKIEGGEMHMWIIKPPSFDPKKKWPLAYLVHGGPQGAWEDGWSYRWCPELWAAQGYVVALPNPRGSTGFGQKYVEEISGDWGGKCYDDLMAGVAYMEKQTYIDKERMAAAGASFGGYMMNWFQAQTGTRFKTLISHAGVYNFESMYATTDELWFDEYEHGGPPWGKNRHAYEKHSPHRYAKSFKTPMLIIQNDLDFRCPVGQGHELFTTLQRLRIPSRFINFPDEGHWVLKPKNSEFWHKEVFAWLKKYAPPGGK